jgi:hypothetical protein
MATRGTVTEVLTKAGIMHFVKLRYGVYKEIGLNRRGKLRADILAINYKKELVVLEVKSSWSDIYNDKKWHLYIPYCDKFLFLISQHLWDTRGEDIKKLPMVSNAGVLVLDSDTGHLRSVIKSTRLKAITHQTRDEVILRMAFRGDYTKRNTRRLRIFIKED